MTHLRSLEVDERHFSYIKPQTAMGSQSNGNVGRCLGDPRMVSMHTPHQIVNGASPQAEKETSAVDAMLKLSCTSPIRSYVTNNLNMKPMTEQLASPNTNATPHVAANGRSPKNFEFPYPNEGSLIKNNASFNTRKHREFIPELRKDDHYWSKRRKNNDAAKRSREKRRINDIAMGATIHEVTDYNNFLLKEIESLKKHFGLIPEKSFLTGDLMPPVPVANKYDIEVHLKEPPSTSCEATTSTIRPHDLSEITTNSMDSNTTPVRQHFSSHGAVPMLVPVNSTHTECGISHNNNSMYGNPSQRYTYNHCATQVATVDAGKTIAKKETYSPSDKSPPQKNHYYNAQELPHVSQIDGTDRNGINNSNYNLPQTHPLLKAHDSPPPPNQPFPMLTSHAPFEQVFNSTSAFHSNFNAPGILPISPDSSCSDSPRSLTISLNTNSDSSDTDLIDTSSAKYLKINDEHQKIPYDLTDYMSRSRERKGIPHKLRHKMNFNNVIDPEAVPLNAHVIQDTYSYQEINDQPEPDNPNQEHKHKHNAKYLIRRHRNNLAAQKCRENRKQLTNMHMSKSTVLEAENMRLKQEMSSLSNEVNDLKDLIDKKKEAQAKGEVFQLPDIDDQIRVSVSSSSIEASSSDAS